MWEALIVAPDEERGTQLAAALDAARRGWPVHVLVPRTKRPALTEWQHRATTDEEDIRAWWAANPKANVGAVVPEDRVVIDVDPRNGGDATLAALCEQHGALPRTLTHDTGGGGQHYVFELNGRPVPGGDGKLGPGIDIKAAGSNVVLPGSVHPDTSKRYTIQIDAPVAPVPEWLPDLAAGQANPGQPAARKASLAELRANPPTEGMRDDWLAQCAGHIARTTQDEDEFLRQVAELDALCDPPQGKAAVRAKLGIWRKEQAKRDSATVHPPSQPMPNARLFLADRYGHPERPLLICQGGAFFAWDGTCWPQAEEATLRRDLYELFEGATCIIKDKPRPFSANRRTVGDVLDALKAAAHLPATEAAPRWLDETDDPPAGEVVVCANGIVHVPTRRVLPLTPRLYVNYAVPFPYEAHAPEPGRWLRFLKELWPDDAEAQQLLQEWFGYVVSGDTSLQKILGLFGPRRSGKGTIGRVLRGLLGHHHVAAPTMASFGSQFGLQPLIGKPLAIIPDARLRQGQDVVTERLLSISGEDALDIDRKYKDPWTGQLPTRLMLLSNELPRLVDASGALASRFILLRLTESFLDREELDLDRQLMAELPGIFNWALDGLERLRERGRFTQPESSREMVQELEDLGSPVSAFLRDRCEVGAGRQVGVDDLYHAWRVWCSGQGREHPGTVQTFSKDLRAHLPTLRTGHVGSARKGERKRVFRGISLGQERLL